MQLLLRQESKPLALLIVWVSVLTLPFLGGFAIIAFIALLGSSMKGSSLGGLLHLPLLWIFYITVISLVPGRLIASFVMLQIKNKDARTFFLPVFRANFGFCLAVGGYAILVQTVLVSLDDALFQLFGGNGGTGRLDTPGFGPLSELVFLAALFLLTAIGLLFYRAALVTGSRISLYKTTWDVTYSAWIDAIYSVKKSTRIVFFQSFALQVIFLTAASFLFLADIGAISLLLVPIVSLSAAIPAMTVAISHSAEAHGLSGSLPNEL